MSPRISISLLAAQPDQRLLALARDGNESAFEALVHRYRRPLLRYCRRMRLSDTRAEDVLQQALLQAWLALSRGAEVRELRAWLYRIVHNVAVNAMRGTAESHGELTEAVQARASLASDSNLQRRIAVREALGEVAELPQMQQAAIFLTAVDGQTHDEVAHALGISQGALRGLLYRARATLRSAAAALTPSPLLASASGGTGAAAPSTERLAELAAGDGAGFAGVLLKGAVATVTAGVLATGAGVVAHHGRESVTPHHGATSAASLAPLAHSPEGSGLPSASTVALLDRRSTRRGHGENASHGKHSPSRRARNGEQHGHDGSHDGVAHGGRDESSLRNDADEAGKSRGGANAESAGGSDDRRGSSAAPGSTGASATSESAERGREQSSSGDRHSGSDRSQAAGAEAGEQAAAEVAQPTAPEGAQVPGEQTRGRDDSAGSSSDRESSRSDG